MFEAEKHIKALSTFLAVSGLVFIFVISAFNAGYYTAMQSEYVGFFSISDFISTALFLTPIILLTVTLFALCFSIYSYCVAKGLVSKNIAVTIAIIVFYLSGAFIVSFTEDLSMRILAYTGGTLFILAALSGIYWFTSIERASSSYLLFSFLFFSSTAVMFGYYMANMDINYRRPSVVQLHNSPSINVRIFRGNGQGILAQSCETGEIIFISWNSIASTTRSNSCAGLFRESIPITLRYLYL